jgi:hypothetical protein
MTPFVYARAANWTDGIDDLVQDVVEEILH